MNINEKYRWLGLYFDLWVYRIQYYQDDSIRLQYFTEDIYYNLKHNFKNIHNESQGTSNNLIEIYSIGGIIPNA